MNANELAEDLEGAKLVILKLNEMLRQQQAEIEALKAAKIRAYDNGVEDGRKPNTNNEPVAWMDEDENVVFEKCKAYPIPLYTHQYERPHNTVLVPCDKLAEMQAEINALKKEAALQRLSDFTQEAECKHGVDDGACKECYQEVTHPVKELTDEEIIKVNEDIGTCWDVPHRFAIQIARAILIKAQNK